MQTRKLRLLVVEDDPAYLYLIRRAFSQRTEDIRWELMIAEDGAQALSALLDEDAEGVPLPELVLLDWNLPRVTGSEVLRRAKEHENLRKIPILVFSASSETEDIHTAYSYHANGYFTKPADPDLLAEVVETIERFWTTAELPRILR